MKKDLIYKIANSGTQKVAGNGKPGPKVKVTKKSGK